MEKSVGNAFFYMFKDEGWLKKAGILTLLFFVIFIIFYSLVSTFPMILKHPKALNPNMELIRLASPVASLIVFFISGYLSKCTHNVIHSNTQENILLPDWQDNFFNYFIIGAKRTGSYAGVFVLLLPTILLLGIPFIIFWFLRISLGKIFCTEFKFDSYFKWEQAFELIKNNVGLYIGIFLIILVLNLLDSLLFIALLYFKVPNNLSAIISAITTTYLCFVFAYFIGIVGNKPLKLES